LEGKGLGYQELAQVQGEKPATIRMRIKRCLALARKLVSELK
jgi:DNA-directed RNA polymerase specialized sigma24 family protein